MDIIRKLRYRFILLAALSVFIIVTVALFLINVMSARSMQETCLNTMVFIAENGGVMPRTERPRITEGWLFTTDRGEDTLESYYYTRYFSVVLDNHKQATKINIDRIAAFSKEDAADTAQKIQELNETSGFFDKERSHYGFFVSPLPEGGNLVVVMDCSREFSAIQSFMDFSVRFGLACVALFIIIFAALSNRAVKPFILNFENQKRFITNASHELKTPIAIISANAEALEIMNGKNEWTSGILKQVHRVSNLINHLILLSKMSEHSQFQLKKELLNVSDIAQSTIHSFRMLAEEQNKTLDVEIEPSVMITTDGKCFLELINILLDNAVKYCDNGGNIQASLHRKRNEKQVVLSVSNDYAEGEHVDYTKFFERFYRNDQSHNSEKAGYGIGLSMAKEIIELLKGKLQVSWKEGRIIFTVDIESL